MRVLKPSGVGQMQAGGGKVHEALIHSRLMHTAHSTQHTCTCTQHTCTCTQHTAKTRDDFVSSGFSIDSLMNLQLAT